MHTANIMLHVAAGMLALIAGFIALATVKGSKKHISAGLYFLWMIAIVIFTALLGVFAFNRNTFLLVITLLSGYNAFTGTVFPEFQPYSQILPGIFGLTYIIFACYRVKSNALR